MATAKKGSAAGTAAESSSAKVLAVRTPKGKLVRLMTDLEFGVIVDIAQANDVGWAQVVGDPLFSGSGNIAQAVYRAALESVGETPPEKINAKTVFDAFDTVADDAPDYVDNGTPTEGDPETT